MKGFAHLLFLGAVSYGALLVGIYFYQDRLLFQPNIPSRKVTSSPASIGLKFDPVTLIASDGVRLDGWFIPAHDARGVVLFCHGNAGNISHRLESIKIFHDLGMNTFIFDYRGYGLSEGKPTEQGTYLDVEAAWQYLTDQKGVPAEQIVLFGRSLGAAVAAHLATVEKPAGFIVESGFTSVPDIAAQLYPFLPARWMSRLYYPTKEGVRSAACPVLVVHSPDDEIIPFSHGQQIFEAAREPKQFLKLRGGHNEGFLISGEHYFDGLDTFLAGALSKRSPSP